MRRLILSILLLALGVVNAAAQAVLPPDDHKARGHRVPDIALVTGDSTTIHLGDLAGKPLIINPVFTRCPAACPAITGSLRDAVATIGEPGVGYNVVTVSFDPADSLADLRAYRDRLGLPRGWIVATATPANLSRLLEAIDFHVAALDGGGFAHANAIAIIGPDQRVSGFVHGIEFDPSEVRAALERAARSGSLVERFKPQLLLITLLAALTLVIVILTTRKHPGDA
jgi:protein SCO1